MKIKEAAEIINNHIAERDEKARAQGLNSVAWNLRRCDSLVSAEVEAIAHDVASGKGSGGAAYSRKLIKIAKAISR